MVSERKRINRQWLIVLACFIAVSFVIYLSCIILDFPDVKRRRILEKKSDESVQKNPLSGTEKIRRRKILTELVLLLGFLKNKKCWRRFPTTVFLACVFYLLLNL